MNGALINDFLSLIYPRQCEACERILFRHEKMLCNKCLLTLPKSNFHLNKNNPILQTMAGRVPLLNASALYVFEKGGRVQKLLHAIKYENQKKLAFMLGQMAAEEVKNDVVFASADFLIPVPLHYKKLKSRGFNQSEVFAQGISEVLRIPLNTKSVIRQTESATQTKKRKYERWENVAGIFALQEKNSLSNKHLVLVDDVVTTGATIEALWQAIKEIEGIRVSLISIAFANK